MSSFLHGTALVLVLLGLIGFAAHDAKHRIPVEQSFTDCEILGRVFTVANDESTFGAEVKCSEQVFAGYFHRRYIEKAEPEALLYDCYGVKEVSAVLRMEVTQLRLVSCRSSRQKGTVIARRF